MLCRVQKNYRFLLLFKTVWLCSDSFLLFFYYFHAFFHSLHVKRNEAMMTFGQRLEQGAVQTFGAHHGADLEQTAEHYHVKNLGVLHVGCFVHGVYAVDVDVLAGGWIDDAVAVVDKDAAGFNLRLKLLQ